MDCNEIGILYVYIRRSIVSSWLAADQFALIF